MNKYVGVISSWWMKEQSFTLFQIVAENSDQAELQLHRAVASRRNLFNHASGCVIEFQDSQELAGRQLTWRERITGRLGG